MYDYMSNKYMIANIRQMPLPTNEPEHFEDWRPFIGPMFAHTTSFSKFLADREGDAWFL